VSETQHDLPEVILTRAEGLALYDRAVEGEDFERASMWMDLLLAVNDPEEAQA
jgi:hypothetical protein